MPKFRVSAQTTELHDLVVEVEADDQQAAEQIVLDREFEDDDCTEDTWVDTIDTKIQSTEEVK